MKPVVSVVVCTYNRAHLLDDCLRSLESQAADRGVYEVVVVDNNSSDRTSALASAYASRNAHFRVCRESRQGLSVARNRGFAEAAGDWVAYIDDDARAFPDYVERILEFVGEHPDAACFGGPCEPLYHRSKPSWYLDEYQSYRPAKPRIALLSASEFVNGFNIVFSKRILSELGGFNPLIGMSGRRVAYGEETQVQVRIRHAQGTVYYFSDLLVFHYIDSYKLRLPWLLRSNFANGRDSWETFEHDPSLRERYASLRNAFHTPFRNLPAAWRKYRNGQYRIQNLLIECLAPALWHAGRATSLVGRRSAHRCVGEA